MKPCTFLLLRCRAKIGAAMSTSRNDGKKIPIVETREPQKPATR